jgi:hypothetical protein
MMTKQPRPSTIPEEAAARARERTNCISRRPPYRAVNAVATATDLSRIAEALLATTADLEAGEREAISDHLSRLTDGAGDLAQVLDRPLDDLISDSVEVARERPAELIGALLVGIAITGAGRHQAADLAPSKPHGRTTVSREPVIDQPGSRSTPSRS